MYRNFRPIAILAVLLLPSCLEKPPEVTDLQACMAQIYGSVPDMFGTVNCREYVEIGNISKVDQRVKDDNAEVIAQIDMTFKKSFHPNSTRSDQCAGGMWSGDGFGQNFRVGQVLRVTKSFSFVRFQSGWRCQTRSFSPANGGRLLTEREAAAGTEVVIRDFGLLGKRAPNCSQLPTSENPYLVYYIEDGLVRRSLEAGQTAPRRFSVLSAKRIATDSILVRERIDDTTVVDITMVRQDGRMRAMSSQRVDNGSFLVKDGSIVGTSRETVWTSACSTSQ